MSKILNFEIKNYKGIVSTRIELEGRVNSPVVTLIGLNESGKTTILEALSQFVSSDRSVSNLYSFSPENDDDITFIPVSQKGAFTGTVSVAATVKLDDDEVNIVHRLGQEEGLEVDRETLSKPFKVLKEIRFVDSVLKDSGGSLGFELRVKYPEEEEFEAYAQPDEESENLWLKAAALIVARLPSVAYFPTFLINVPEGIVLHRDANNELYGRESYEDRHYREIVERIIRFSGYDVEKHINRRIDECRAKYGARWLEYFPKSREKSLIDAVFQRVSHTLTQEVIGGWRRILSRDTTARRIELRWQLTEVDEPTAVVSFAVSNGDSDYKINERSVGFRWFFTFLLLTGFQSEKKQRQTIFIFDEPAANLHSRAQVELLRYFDNMTKGGDKIIYSTHSHHMIDPKWLSSAYIIENRSAGDEDPDGFSLDFTPAEICAIKYKRFLSDYPSRSHYFQPVIDKLQYIVPDIVETSPCVVVEGISDYYALKAASLSFKGDLSFGIVPGVGSGASGPLISIFMGRGERFVVLLDDDREGRAACERYRSNWILSDQEIITFADIDLSFKGMALESLVGKASLEVAQARLGLEKLPDKTKYALLLAEHYHKADASEDIFSSQGLANLMKVLDYLEARFKTASDDG